ncbi:MAG: CsbD family protein [Terracidiphilus sp.]|jgi:uncharacterized protein YjbJ (UPF0337 family)
MDKDRVKGTIDDSAGRVKRQVGEWTGDRDAQIEGTAQQLKGKAEKIAGKIKDTVRDSTKKTGAPTDRVPEPKDRHVVISHR